jgi:Ran GTPase-activating protein (RanGAP) involved in mRNA processing and transport
MNQEFCDALTNNTTLTRLDMCENRIGRMGGFKMVQILKINTTLENLNLSGNLIGGLEGLEIAQTLKNQTRTKKMKVINLQSNVFGASKKKILSILSKVVEQVMLQVGPEDFLCDGVQEI